MPWRPHPKMADNQSCWATCDRCGLIGNLRNFKWERRWEGMSLNRTGFIVCYKCLDVPSVSPSEKTLVLPPDPMPVMNTRPEPYAIDEA